MAGSSLTELPFSSGDAQLMPIIISIRFNTKYRLGRIGPKWTHCLAFATNNGFLYIAPRSLGWPLRSQLILTYLGESILLYFVHFILVDHVLSSYFTFDSLPWKKSTDFILIESYFLCFHQLAGCFSSSWDQQYDSAHVQERPRRARWNNKVWNKVCAMPHTTIETEKWEWINQLAELPTNHPICPPPLPANRATKL